MTLEEGEGSEEPSEGRGVEQWCLKGRSTK